MKKLLIGVSLLTMVSCTPYELISAPFVHSTELRWILKDLDSIPFPSDSENQAPAYRYDPETKQMVPIEDEECMTDACITERTGDVNPADPDENTQNFTEGERNE
jgi:hypothetical protein